MKRGLELIVLYRTPYLLINLAFYGLVVLGTAYAFVNPDLQKQLTQTILQGFDSGPLSLARDAYLSGNVASAALVTFLVNTFIGSIVALTLPSLVIPFAGVGIGLYRAVIIGLALAPTTPEMARAMVPHSLTLVLEGQGYVLAMFGTYLLWAKAFSGARSGISGFFSGYGAGLKANLFIYLLVVLVLAVAAVYEAFEIIYIVGRG